jgi:cobalt/nickel transport system permease protein
MAPIDRIAHQSRWRSKSLAEKALLALGMLCLALVLPPFPGALVVAALVIAATLWGAGVPPRAWAAAMAAPLGFMATGALSLLVGLDGGSLALAPGGGLAAAALVARAMAGVACLLLLGFTTPMSDLVNGMRRLGVPAEVADIALLIYRFMFLLADTALAMDAAQAARLGHHGSRRRLRSLGLLVANLLPRALDRARRLEVGLAARGWDGEFRVLSPRRPVSPGGLAAVAAILGLTALVGGMG